MRAAKCKTCIFFEYGLCKRYPKVESKAEIDWCGEWKPAPKEASDATGK